MNHARQPDGLAWAALAMIALVACFNLVLGMLGHPFNMIVAVMDFFAVGVCVGVALAFRSVGS